MVLPPTHRAASRGDVEEVLRLIHQDPQLIGSTDSSGFTPLIYASLKGHVSVVAVLVDHGANIDHQSDDGITALYGACCNSYVPVVELLMEKRANPTLSTLYCGVSPLMAASQRGRVEVVRRLLHHPSVLSTANHYDRYDGRTALYNACEESHHEVVKMLLEAGADPTFRAYNGKTAMDIATERDSQECISLLKEWDRSYIITMARLLYDAFCRYHQDATRSAASMSGGGDQGANASNNQSGVEAAIPIYLKGRVEGGQPLPKVEMVDGYEEGSLVESVLEYVICGGLKVELFVELMEMLGKTGYRQEEEGI